MVRSIVLCYHAISPSWEADLSVTPERLERQVGLLLKRGYRAARFTDVVHSPAGEKVVAITFDDAFRSVIQLALPILQRFGAPGTVFVPTDYIGAEAPLQLPGLDRWLEGPLRRRADAHVVVRAPFAQCGGMGDRFTFGVASSPDTTRR